MANVASIHEWQLVAERVETLLPQALRIKEAHVRAADAAGLLATSAIAWHPEKNTLTAYYTKNTDKAAVEKYAQALSTVCPKVEAVILPLAAPISTDTIVIKTGSFVPGLPTVWNGANKLLLGPTPLSNGIVASLLSGGLGYGAGALAENLFPEKYIQRGKLRKTLAGIGLLGGVGLAGLQGYSNARAMQTGLLRGLVTSNKAVPPYMDKYEKTALLSGSGGLIDTDPMFAPSVYVPQFNNAVWNDVRRGQMFGFDQHTPPAYAAATSGLMSGISSMNRSPIISPMDVVRGIASAGVGLATANVVGKGLSALAGLSPAGQGKLQEMGLWGGMMHALVPPLFGAR